jgi:O-methyltransferase
MPLINSIKARTKIILVRNRLASPDRLKRWMLQEVRPRTMVSPARIDNVYRIAGNPDLPDGAFVECGVGYAGCVAAMAYAGGPRRKVWGFDSFEGMPPLSNEDEGDGEKWVGFKASGRGLEDAQQTVDHFRLDNVTLVKGWFNDTLPPNRDRIGPIAVLRLDNDWYESTRFCLHQLYDQVVIGGCIIIDDYYTFLGCRKAVDEFRKERNISTPVVVTESDSETWWVRES